MSKVTQSLTIHRMTVDVEDWFHAEAQGKAIPRDAWETQRLRILPNMLAILESKTQHRVSYLRLFRKRADDEVDRV